MRIFNLFIIALGFFTTVAFGQSDIFTLSGPRVSTVTDMATDKEGFLYFSGTFKGTLTMENMQLNSEQGDTYLCKAGNANAIQWSIQISGGIKEIEAWNDKLIVLGQYAQNLNFCGTTKTSAYTNSFLACLDNKGKTIWLIDQKTTGNVFPTQLEIDNAGNIYVICTFYETVTLENIILKKAGNKNAYIAKYTPAGKLLWAKHFYGGDSFLTGVWPADLCFDKKNNQVIVSGNFAGECKFDAIPIKTRKLTFGPTEVVWGNEVFLAKYTLDGVCSSVQSIITEANVSQVQADTDGFIYIAGHFKGEVAPTKAADNTGISYFCGTTRVKTTVDPDMGPSEDGYIIKLNPQNQLQWIVRNDGRSTDRIIAFTMDAIGAIYACSFAHVEIGISGKTKKIPVQPVSGTGEQLYKGEIIIVKVSPAGEPEWLKLCGGTDQDNPYDICLINNTLKIGGLLSGKVTFENKSYTIGGKYNGVVVSLSL